MDLVIKYLETHREGILMDLELIKNDTKTRYAIEKRKQLEPILEQVTRAVEILSEREQANDNIPLVINCPLCGSDQYSSESGWCLTEGCKNKLF